MDFSEENKNPNKKTALTDHVQLMATGVNGLAMILALSPVEEGIMDVHDFVTILHRLTVV